MDYVDTLGRGNGLISLPALTSAVNRMASCKYCYRDQMENEFESFLQYCNVKRDEVVKEGRAMSLMEEASHLRDNLDIKKWYNEWKQKREVKSGPIHVAEHTVGLATELAFSCDWCTLLGKMTDGDGKITASR